MRRVGRLLRVGPSETVEVGPLDVEASMAHVRGDPLEHQARIGVPRSDAQVRQAEVGALRQRDPETVLAPRKCEVSVLFCDLRGFSRRTEQEADDLLGLLQRVSDALGVMTRQILAHGGVVGDFHGDAAMGFWGWPLQQEDAIERAAVVIGGTSLFGGEGRIMGTLIGALSLGVVNKFLEPFTGAVLAKILVLVFIILFIQKRPRGLFPQKGRAAEG